ncbi:hypothetical protein ACTFIV_005343 [Dictyostelium citrinum]
MVLSGDNDNENNPFQEFFTSNDGEDYENDKEDYIQDENNHNDNEDDGINENNNDDEEYNEQEYIDNDRHYNNQLEITTKVIILVQQAKTIIIIFIIIRTIIMKMMMMKNMRKKRDDGNISDRFHFNLQPIVYHYLIKTKMNFRLLTTFQSSNQTNLAPSSMNYHQIHIKHQNNENKNFKLRTINDNIGVPSI